MGKLKEVLVTFNIDEVFIFANKRMIIKRVHNATYRCEILNAATQKRTYATTIMPIDIKGNKYTFVVMQNGFIHNMNKRLVYENDAKTLLKSII